MNSTRQKLSCTVIICTRNRLDDLCVCLNSLKQQTVQPEQLIIIDSSTTPLDQQERFKELFNEHTFPACHLVYEHTSPGLPLQRNRGIAKATGDIIYFFDDDVILQPSYLAIMQQTFAQFPIYNGGMGTITNISSKKSLFNAVRAFFFLHRNYASGAFTFSGLPTYPYGNKNFCTVQVLGGCCMAYRRSVFTQDLFDEKLNGYAFMEDCDFSRRVSYKAPLFFNPQAQMVHLESPTAREKVVAVRAMLIKNYTYLFYKNFYEYNKLKVIAYWWSIIGLFVQAAAMGNMQFIKGYVQGLKEYYIDKKRL